MELKQGTLLQNDKYQIIRSLGHGGFGVTYLAEQTLAGRQVCIKEFFPKEYYNREVDSCHITVASQGNVEFMERYKEKFMKEAKTIARLKHPHIIEIYDVFKENNTGYYVMEYIDGITLHDKIKASGAMSEEDAKRYIRQVASALDYIHSKSITHLDVKPGNVMVGADDRAILIDFGLSKQYDDSGNQTSSTPVGISQGFAPMEQYKAGGVSEFSPTTDIYSLGATLYYLLTAKVPPMASDIVEGGLPALPATLSQGVRRAIEAAMEVRRKDRPQSIAEFLQIMDGAAAPATEDAATKIVASATDDESATKVVAAEGATTPAKPVSPKVEDKQHNAKIKQQPAPGAPKPASRSRKGRAVWLVLMLLVVLGGIAAYAVLSMDSSSDEVSITKSANTDADTGATPTRYGFYDDYGRPPKGDVASVRVVLKEYEDDVLDEQRDFTFTFNEQGDVSHISGYREWFNSDREKRVADQTTEYTYDSKGRILSAERYDGNVLGKKETFVYDHMGNVAHWSIYANHGDGDIYANELDYEYKYDSKGRMTEHTLTETVDGISYINLHKYTYDIRGNKVREDYCDADGNIWKRVVWVYDRENRNIEESSYSLNNETEEMQQNATTKWEYNSDGLVIEERRYGIDYETNEWKLWETIKYKYENDLLVEMRSEEYIYKFVYDNRGNVIYALGTSNDGEKVELSYEYIYR